MYILRDELKKNESCKLYVERVLCAQDRGAPILFLPGGPGFDHQKYKFDHTFLKNEKSMIFWDPRGCGKSGPVNLESYGLQTYVDDAAAICQELKLGKVIILGTSFGAVAGQKFALDYPHLVEKLILCVGATSHHFIDKAKKNLKDRGNNEQIELGLKIFEGAPTKIDLKHFSDTLGPLYSKAIENKKKVPKAPSSANFEVALHGFRTYLKEFDFRDQIHQIFCPTLILAGAHDWVCDPSESVFMSEKIPNNQCHIFEGSSHFLATDVPDEYQKTILNFL